MKKYQLSKFFIFALITHLLLFWSCSKDEFEPIGLTPEIQQAKSWYENNPPIHLESNPFFKSILDWNTAFIEPNNIVYIPLNNEFLKNNNTTTYLTPFLSSKGNPVFSYPFLILEKSLTTNTYNIKLKVYLSDEKPELSDHQIITNNTYISFDSYNFLLENTYNKIQKNKQSNTNTKIVSCYDYYWVVYVGGVEVSSTYLFTICPGVETQCRGNCGSGGGGEVLTLLVEGSKYPILSLSEFLNCLNLNQSAKLTIYVYQPVASSSATSNGTFVGHAFMSITQGNQTKVIGYYPTSDWITPMNNTSSGILGNDSNSNYNVSVSKDIDNSDLNSILSYININADRTYNLDSYNCTDFVIEIGNKVGLNLPDAYGTWLGGGGSNPGVLGQHIRNMSATGLIINKSDTRLIAPKTTNCN